MPTGGADANWPIENHRRPVPCRPQHVMWPAEEIEQWPDMLDRRSHPSLMHVADHPTPLHTVAYGVTIRYRMEMRNRERLKTEDWTTAALVALAEGGIAAVAVEPLATSLGATKGSFYWHFSNRDALVEAALLEWERIDTEEVIALVQEEPDVHRRLRTLLAVAIGDESERSGNRVELALQSTAGHPLVAPVLARVTDRRVRYLTDQFSALGFDAEHSRQRALLAYTAYLGHAQLAHATPGAAPTDSELSAYIDSVIARLIAP